MGRKQYLEKMSSSRFPVLSDLAKNDPLVSYSMSLISQSAALISSFKALGKYGETLVMFKQATSFAP